MKLVILIGDFTRIDIPSECPDKLPTNGFENIFYILEATSALWNSRGLLITWRFGLGFLYTFIMSFFVSLP
jgi:hypothetical protein